MSQTSRGPWLVLAGALCFSTTGVTQALLAPLGASPLTVATVRTIVAAVALLALCAWRNSLPSLQNWQYKNLILCTLGILGFQVFFFTGVLHAGVALGTVVSLGFVPISAALMAWILFGERPAKAWYPATALAVLGLVLLNTGGAGNVPWTALLAPLASGASYALYLVFSKPLTQKHSAETIMCVIFCLSGICMLPLLWIYPNGWLLKPQGLLAAAHLGIITGAAAYYFTLAGLRCTPTATASTLGLAEPLCASLLGIFLLGEAITAQGVAGMVCILASAVLLIAVTRFFPDWG